MDYRREIDGLRAVAVLPVIFFHAGLPGFSGGFVGVDVFFVISGYLITAILIADLARGEFSAGRFYERRARRILPALCLVMGCTIPVAFLWLPPDPFRDFAEAVGTVAIFVSNLLFLSKVDYFAPAAELNPLLHTWSLAVEEQYYLLFPPLLWGVWRIARPALPWVLAVLALGSLFWAEVLSRHDAAMAFFLIVTRAWELLAGALCTLVLRHRPPSGNDALAATGIGAILLSVGAFDGNTRLPSLLGLLPVGGAVLVILFATPRTIAGRALGLPVLVGLGLISYSAYLWHQPLFAFARVRSFAEPGTGAMLALAALALVLAWASWRFVELPFRRRAGPVLPSRSGVFAASALAMAGFFGFGLWGHLTEGRAALWVRMADPAVVETHALIETARRIARRSDDGACVFNVPALTPEVEVRLRDCRARIGPGVLVIGDSHAIDLAEALAAQGTLRFLAGVTEGGCRPDDSAGRCSYEAVLALVAAEPGLFDRIVFEIAGQHLIRDQRGRIGNRIFAMYAPAAPIDGARITILEDRIDRVATYLERLSVHLPVIWLGPRPEPHLPQAYILARGCGHPYAFRPGQEALFAKLDGVIAGRVAQGTVRFESQTARLALTMPDDFMTCAEGLHWTDSDHLSTSGRARFGARLLPLLSE